MKRLGLFGAAGVALVALAFVVSYFLGGENGAPDPATTASVPAAGPAKSTVKSQAPAASAGQDSPKPPESPKPAPARRAPKQPAGGAEVAAKPTPAQPATKPIAPQPTPIAPVAAPRQETTAPKSSSSGSSVTAPPPSAAPPKAPSTTPKAPAPKAPAVAALPPSATPKASKPAAPDRVGPEPPSFDVVRIEPDGDVVMAGRAPPGWRIIVRDGAREVGRATANARGEWVLLPDRKLAPGSRQFRLTARSPDGRELGAESVVVLMVPERQPRPGAAASAKKPSPPVAVALPEKPGGRARLLQAPTPAPAAEPGPKVAIDLIEIEGDGGIVVSGHADAGAVVRIYLNGAALGDARAGDARAGGDGAWQLAPEERIRPGSYTLRADRIGADGAVLARIEVKFEHGGPVASWPDGREIIVVRGHTLWWIARRLYGRGARYTLIFDANRDSIRDPDLIYPGQVFSLPRTN